MGKKRISKVDQYRTIIHSWDLGSLHETLVMLFTLKTRKNGWNPSGTANKNHHFSDHDQLARLGLAQAIFFGLGSDGTVGANKAAAAIIGERTEFYSQAPGPKRGLPGLAGPFKRFVLGEPWCFLMFFLGYQFSTMVSRCECM